MAQLRRRAVARAGALRRGHRGGGDVVRHRRDGRARRRPLQLRGAGASRARARPRAEGEAAHVQRLLRGAHVLARRARPLRPSERRAVRRSGVRRRLRHARARGVRGHLVARRPDAPPLLRRRRARGEPQRLALSARRRRHAARDDLHARRRQPVRRRLREPGRRQRRPRLRRRRLRRAERAPGARGAALRRGLLGGDGRSRSHGAAAAREHDLAHRPGELRGAGAAAAGSRSCQSDGTNRGPQPARLPGAGAPELLPAAAGGRRGSRASSSARTCSTRWRSASATTSRRSAASRRSASRSRAGATRSCA